MSLDEVIPDPVFRPHLGEYVWIEFDYIFSTAFFHCLQACASRNNEDAFHAACLGPDCQGNFGHSGYATFTSTSHPREYHAYLDATHDAPINARHIGERFVFWSSQHTWAFFGDRSVELTVGAHQSRGGWPLIKGLRYHIFSTVLSLAAAPYRGNLPDDKRERYERNYRAASWLLSRYVEGP